MKTTPSASPGRSGLLLAAGFLGSFFLGFVSHEVRVSLSRSTQAGAPAAPPPAGTPPVVNQPSSGDAVLERRTRAIRDFLSASQRQGTRQQRRQLEAALRQLTVEDLPFALESALRSGSRGEGTLAPLLQHWAGLDPQGAANHLTTHARALGDQLRPCGKALALAWAERDAAAAQTWAAGVADPLLRSTVVSSVLEGQGATDPQAALRWLRTLPKMTPSPNENGLFLRWSQIDPGAAVREMATRPAYDGAREMENHILRQWSKRDPVAALAWTAQLPKTQYSAARHEGTWETWAREQPEAALAAARQQPNEKIRTLTLLAAIDTEAKRNPAAVERILQELSTGADRRTGYARAAQALRATDPAQAAQWALQADTGSQRSRLGETLNAWSRSDAAAAMAFVDQHIPSSDPAYQELLKQATSIEAQRDPRGTLEMLLRRPQLPVTAAWEAVKCLSEQNPQAALAWADQHLLPQAKDQGEAYRVFLTASLSQTQPELAGERFRALPPGQQDPQSAEDLAVNWSQRDFQQAQAWVGTLPPAAQGQAYRTLGRHQGDEDEAATKAWLEQLPAGPGRDAAVQGVVERMATFNPAGAAQHITKISDPKLRAKAIEELTPLWQPYDPAAYAAWRQQFAP